MCSSDLPERGDVSVVSDHAALCAIYDRLKVKGYAQYVSFNKGLVKGLYYYTGMLFEAHIKGIRKTVASGGRYDELVARFGYDCPAVGYALQLNHLSAQGEPS